jgi:hypothetical protein
MRRAGRTTLVCSALSRWSRVGEGKEVLGVRDILLPSLTVRSSCGLPGPSAGLGGFWRRIEPLNQTIGGFFVPVCTVAKHRTTVVDKSQVCGWNILTRSFRAC